ncbi:MAG: N-acetyl sugar amidotransferase [Ignavibacteriaceae bacterium]|nr:N-acetyl sugar amidotransferase [Ignavibacteriaceae bacterium]
MICKLGIWDETVPGFVFDENGVSNYARIQQKLMYEFPRGGEGKRKWIKVVEETRREWKNKSYDCVVGVSGGTDSSYLLYVIKEAGLRPLAVNLDNGWNSEIAVANIQLMTNALGIDLETYVIDYEEIKDLMRCYMEASLPWIDVPTDIAIQSILYKLASKIGVKYIFIGNDFRSEGKQPTEWTYSDQKQLLHLHKMYGKVKLKTFPMLSLVELYYLGYVKGVKLFPVYNFIDYNKQDAQQFLIDKFGWRYYGEHHHENLFTKFAIGYWMYEKFGIDKRKITYSAQVLSGKITRKEALAKIANPPYSKEDIDKDLEYILNKLSYSKSDFQRLWNAPNKSFHDYPSYFNFIIKAYQYLWPVLKGIVPTKPKIFYELEERGLLK